MPRFQYHEELHSETADLFEQPTVHEQVQEELAQVAKWKLTPRGHHKESQGLVFGHIDRRHKSRRSTIIGHWVRNPETGEMEQVPVDRRRV